MIKQDIKDTKVWKGFVDSVCPICNSKKVLMFASIPGKYTCLDCKHKFEEKKEEK